MCDGKTVILPVNWNLFDEEDITAVYTEEGVLIVDPANPADNLAKVLSIEDIQDIKSHATKAIHLINCEDWGKLFQDDFFDQKN